MCKLQVLQSPDSNATGNKCSNENERYDLVVRFLVSYYALKFCLSFPITTQSDPSSSNLDGVLPQFSVGSPPCICQDYALPKPLVDRIVKKLTK
jgi:hypothetical protein